MIDVGPHLEDVFIALVIGGTIVGIIFILAKAELDGKRRSAGKGSGDEKH